MLCPSPMYCCPLLLYNTVVTVVVFPPCPLGFSVNEFLGLLKKMDVNLDTISTKVNSALTRLEKRYDVSLALYQRFEK